MYEDIWILKDIRIHLVTGMYNYLHLYNCASAPKKIHARTSHAHVYMLTLSQIHNYTYNYNFVHALTHYSLTHSVIHSFTHSLTRSHIFILFNSHSLSFPVTSMLVQALTHAHAYTYAHTYNYMYTRTDLIMHSYNLILVYIHSHTCAHTRTHTHTKCMCMRKFR